MTKPWEKTYQTHPLDFRVLVEKDPHGDGDGWLAVADLRVPVGECREVGALLTAAPDMARALNGALMVLDGRPCTPAFREAVLGRVLDAISKAGVPLP